MSTEPITVDSADRSAAVAAQSGPFGVVGTWAARAWQRVEAWIVRVGDWLNPILVKETRQALKSRQFQLTFLLVLAACWLVTIGRVALFGPDIYYSAVGSTLLYWYYVILAFPLAIIVPYSAFRSLAAEREDNTYDLLSITALKPRQIISGKLGSAIGQMTVYFSAVMPCLAFTYLLRGVDLPLIIALLVFSFFASLGLSMVGLLLATLSRQKYGQVFYSVAFIAVLVGLFWWTIIPERDGIAYEFIYNSYSYAADPLFWIMCAGFFTLYVTTFWIAFYAAAGMITFSSENRSRPLRIAMLAQQASWLGWLGAIWIFAEYDRIAVFTATSVAGVYWYVMGILLTGERSQMSQRAQRTLPKTFLGRVFLTWLNPGPASGFMFVVSNTTALVMLMFWGVILSQLFGPGKMRWPTGEALIYLSIVGWGYIIAYLGAGLLIVSTLRRFANVSMLAVVLIQLLLVLAGSGIPWTIQMMTPELRYVEYSYLQITNPFATLNYLVDRSSMPSDAVVLLCLVSTAAVCVLLLNLPGVVRELRRVRVALPKRVADDELELHPAPTPRPTSPWDDEG